MTRSGFQPTIESLPTIHYFVPPESMAFTCLVYSCFLFIHSSYSVILSLCGTCESQLMFALVFARCSATSALSHVVLGQFKTIVIMLSGFLVFKSDPGLTSLYGAVIALGGMSVYTYLGLKESTTGGKRIPSASRRSSLSLKSKVIIDEEKPETRPVDSV